tara:strand:+ start:501 stop:911 length:411 start_codon:yes stop_codon:yes gene_type:complete
MSKPWNSKRPTNDTSILHRIGVIRHIHISNDSDNKAYVIVAPTPIKSISGIGVNKIGTVEFEKSGDYKSEEMVILPGKIKEFELETVRIYVSVWIEIETNVWRQSRKNRLINSSRNDYVITQDMVDECINTTHIHK